MPIDDAIVMHCTTMLNPAEAKMRDGGQIELHSLGLYAGYLFVNQQTLEAEYPELWQEGEAALDAAADEPSDPAKANRAWRACCNLLADRKMQKIALTAALLALVPFTATALTGTAPVVTQPASSKQIIAWRAITSLPTSADLVIAGGGLSGAAAAIAAARHGVSVVIIEPTNMLGGQAGPSGVSALDRMRVYRKSIDGHGIWQEFANKIEWLYAKVYKRPINVCHYSANYSLCPNPVAVDRTLTNMLSDAGVTVVRNTDVTGVLRSGNLVRGLRVGGAQITAKIVVDATEYGDLMRLGSIPYRVSDGTWNHPGDSNNACTMPITYTATIRKYPNGVPAALRITTPPPGFDEYKDGLLVNYPPPGVTSGRKTGPVGFAGYRAAPDFSSTAWATGERWELQTRSNLNWANDTHVPGSYLTDLAVREQKNGEGKLRTLAVIYHLQNVVGIPWSVATDEGFSEGAYSSHNRHVPAEYAQIERHMPPTPYVRESMRLIGVKTLTGKMISRPANGDAARWTTDVIATGHNPQDQHACKDEIDFEERLGETLADKQVQWHGPYPIPLGSLIPQDVDGFLAAEKNISQSRLAAASTRVHPTVMAIGEAVGSLAGIAVKNSVQPRKVPLAAVQVDLANNGVLLTPWRISGFSNTHPDYPAVALGLARGHVSWTVKRPTGDEASVLPANVGTAKSAGRATIKAMKSWLVRKKG